ncbi:Cytochrome P450 9e2 [Melipona quadrifasciata]|uniref:Cytochrome P450 9e2 n=1 Tax=Melipona quadrifasciata TaxID=166423 RepID=A0A0N0U3N4_9HYME|nr:Cytochrome P450 9e2 [Melipona quadrifasciata]
MDKAFSDIYVVEWFRSPAMKPHKILVLLSRRDLCHLDRLSIPQKTDKFMNKHSLCATLPIRGEYLLEARNDSSRNGLIADNRGRFCRTNTVIYYQDNRNFDFFKKRGMVFLGGLWETFLQRLSFAETVKKSYNLDSESKYVSLFDMTMFVIRDLDLIKSITMKNFDYYPNHRMAFEPDLELFFSKNLFSPRRKVEGSKEHVVIGPHVQQDEIYRSYVNYVKVFKQKIVDFFKELVARTIKVRDENGIIRPHMIQLMTESGKELTIDDMTARAFIFFFGGFEVQKRLQDEIDQVLEYCNGQVTYEAINRMKYLEAVILESFLMYLATILAGSEAERMTSENGFWLKMQPRNAKKNGVRKDCLGTTMLIEKNPDRHPDN